MKVVIDTNILLSAIIRDSTTRKLLSTLQYEFYYPEISFHELRKHKTETLEKSGMPEKTYNTCLNILLKKIHLMPDEQLKPFLSKAKQLIAHRDPNDIVFIAAALSIENAVIWSEDKDFEAQNNIPILKTKDILTLDQQ